MRLTGVLLGMSSSTRQLCPKQEAQHLHHQSCLLSSVRCPTCAEAIRNDSKVRMVNKWTAQIPKQETVLLHLHKASAAKPQAVLTPSPLVGQLLDPGVVTCHTCKQDSLIQGLAQRKKNTEKPDGVIGRSDIHVWTTAISFPQGCTIPPLPVQIHLPHSLPAHHSAFFPL